jgi:hypothetical protein
MQERRRFPRRVIENESVSVPATLRVQVVDISVAGALLKANRPVSPGARGSLRMNIDGVPVTTNVLVRRVTEDAATSTGYDIGATFMATTAEHRHLIDKLTRQ